MQHVHVHVACTCVSHTTCPYVGATPLNKLSCAPTVLQTGARMPTHMRTHTHARPVRPPNLRASDPRAHAICAPTRSARSCRITRCSDLHVRAESPVVFPPVHAGKAVVRPWRKDGAECVAGERAEQEMAVLCVCVCVCASVWRAFAPGALGVRDSCTFARPASPPSPCLSPLASLPARLAALAFLPLGRCDRLTSIASVASPPSPPSLHVSSEVYRRQEVLDAAHDSFRRSGSATLPALANRGTHSISEVRKDAHQTNLHPLASLEAEFGPSLITTKIQV